MTPTVGRIVLIRHPRGKNPRATTSPAIVTAVHSPTCINVQAFIDGPNFCQWLTSVMHEDCVDDGCTGPIWHWPPRAPEPV